MFSDKLIGLLLVVSSSAFFLFYTVWILVLPFAEKDHPILDYFPDIKYAIAVPTTLFVCALVGVGLFIGIIMLKEARRNKEK
jgi:dolichyl-phosphate mannosyltransferase polypeptide 2 regulatory subunit